MSRTGQVQQSGNFDAELGFIERSDAWSAFPHPLFAAIRAESPVFWSDTLACWVVAGYPEATEVLRDASRFVVDYDQQPEPRQGDSIDEAEFPYMVDPPRHGQLRGVLMRTGAFTPDAVEELVPAVRDATEVTLARWRAGSSSNAVADFAGPIACAAFAAYFGLSESEMRRIAELWLRERPTGELGLLRIEPLPAHLELYGFMEDLIERRLADPGEDLISRLAAANRDRRRMSRGSLIWNMIDLILNGFPSVQSAIALTVSALADHPRQYAALRQDLALAPGTVAEVFRWAAPTPLLSRRAKTETKLGHAVLATGSRIYLFIPSANRDERVWERPDEFDIRRPLEPPHLTFGAGIHQTPGAHLARMVLVTCVRVLAESTAEIERLGPTEYWPADTAELQVKALPVAFA